MGTPEQLDPQMAERYLKLTGLRDTIIKSDNMKLLLSGSFPYYLYWVVSYPTTGGTAPDAADVSILMNGEDLLGGKGVNLIHATATQDTFPYSSFMSSYRFPPVSGPLTLRVANQATASASYTIDLYFVR